MDNYNNKKYSHDKDYYNQYNNGWNNNNYKYDENEYYSDWNNNNKDKDYDYYEKDDKKSSGWDNYQRRKLIIRSGKMHDILNLFDQTKYYFFE